ncbi:MAG: hypothetical protein IH846_11905 [Acidobacteria bacterium]|nr:hypothetical protein [Acidobacteriota bacterium]
MTLDGTIAPLFTVSGGQINAQVPFDVLPGQVSVWKPTSVLHQNTIFNAN